MTKILFLMSYNLYQAIRNNIVAKKKTELVLLFYKNITKLIFLWRNIGQKCFNVLKLLCLNNLIIYLFSLDIYKYLNIVIYIIIFYPLLPTIALALVSIVMVLTIILNKFLQSNWLKS